MIRGSCAATVITVLISLSRLTAPAAADEFSDFRIPDHGLFSWTGTVSSGLQGFRGSGRVVDSSFGSDKRAAGSMDLRWFHETDALQTQLVLQAGTDADAGAPARGSSCTRRVRRRWCL